MISEERKLQYWDHFTDPIQKGFRPRNITDLRLGQMKNIVLNDAGFWQDVIVLPKAVSKTPDELMADSALDYQRTRSKFWMMIRKKIEQHLLTESIKRSKFSKKG